MKKKIAIIGSGIAGLTLANLIKKESDHEFMLYEKLESLSLDDGSVSYTHLTLPTIYSV